MPDAALVPLGYMLKRISSPAPEWMESPQITSVCSVSNCISDDFMDYIPLWRHNGWWLFNSAQEVIGVAKEHGVEFDGLRLFFYEAFAQQYDDEIKGWADFAPEDRIHTEVVIPSGANLLGYDVVTFFVATSPECSPLSCCALASELSANSNCLLDTLIDARLAIEKGAFENSEPGPYRIIAVHEIPMQGLHRG